MQLSVLVDSISGCTQTFRYLHLTVHSHFQMTCRIKILLDSFLTEPSKVVLDESHTDKILGNYVETIKLMLLLPCHNCCDFFSGGFIPEGTYQIAQGLINSNFKCKKKKKIKLFL